MSIEAMKQALDALEFAKAHDDETNLLMVTCGDDNGWRFKPSTDWAQGGPIIERERISIEHMAGAGDGGTDVWVATRIENPAFSEEQGATPLIAAMRCFVASKLGDEVDVPDEILEEVK
jgi:hypothetical protein